MPCGAIAGAPGLTVTSTERIFAGSACAAVADVPKRTAAPIARMSLPLDMPTNGPFRPLAHRYMASASLRIKTLCRAGQLRLMVIAQDDEKFSAAVAALPRDSCLACLT